MQETSKIWMNGELVDWADATVHVGVHGLHYGTGVFEGIRAYETSKGPAVFRLADHLQRMHDSARLLYMELPYTIEELRSATHEVVRANGLPACYIRPIAFFGYGSLGVHTRGNPVDTVIMSWPWGAYLGDDSLGKGITAKISSWTRVGPNVIPHVAKATGIYLNSMLATTEAQRAGYDESILLTDQGFVADGPGENIFVVKNGRIVTPPLSTSILPGVTRDCVIQIAQELGYVVEEEDMIRTDLVPSRRGVHDRHRGRGDARAGDRRHPARRRRGHTRDPERVPRRGQRPRRAVESLARRGRGARGREGLRQRRALSPLRMQGPHDRRPRGLDRRR